MALTRRDFMGAVVAAAGMTFADPSGRRFQGVFPIMQTPFTSAGKLDTDVLAREVEFLNRIRIPGMVWPQLASEYSSLTTEERFAGAEAIVQAGRKKAAAIVLGARSRRG